MGAPDSTVPRFHEGTPTTPVSLPSHDRRPGDSFRDQPPARTVLPVWEPARVTDSASDGCAWDFFVS